MTTIDNLQETTNTSGLYALGTQEGISVKYNLEGLDDKINNTSDLIGGEVIQDYNPQNNYYKNQYIRKDGKLYRVNDTILGGEEPGNKISETNVFSEFQDIKGTGSNEILNVQILTSDGNTSPGILQNNVNLTFDDGTTGHIECNENGIGSISIAKGRIYSASVGNQVGYHTPGSYSGIKASLSQRTLQFIYLKEWIGSSNVSVELSVSNGGILSDFSGLTLTALEDGSLDYMVSESGVIEDDKVIYRFSRTFTSGKSYTIPVPHDVNSSIYTTNTRPYSNDTSDLNLYITPKNPNETLRVNYRLIKQPYGIYLVKDDGTEVDIGTWEGLGSGETKETWPALHINTENLAKLGLDYYVMCKDLTSERLKSTKAWSGPSRLDTPGTECTNKIDPVVNSNGKLNTYTMSKTNRDGSETSPAADYAVTFSFTLRSKTAIGYIGSKYQFEDLYNVNENYNKVISTLLLLGYSNVNFRTIQTWTSNQSGYTYTAWNYKNGAWDQYGDGNLKGKILALLVIPFFSF